MAEIKYKIDIQGVEDEFKKLRKLDQVLSTIQKRVKRLQEMGLNIDVIKEHLKNNYCTVDDDTTLRNQA